MKLIKFSIIIMVIIAIVFCYFKIKNSFSNIRSKENLTNEFNTVLQNIKGIDTGDIQKNLSGKIEEAKGIAEQYYNDVLKDYVDRAKEGVSGAVKSAKGYYNQGIDDIGETITNKINTKVSEGLDKIKVK